MSKKTPEQKAQEKLAKLLGMEAPKTLPSHTAHERSMEAEAVLEYYENPRSFKEKDCKQCGRTFATRGAPVGYCSDPCRARAFEERMGVMWKPLRSPEERWGFMGEPLTVPPEALIVARAVMVEQAAAEEAKPAPYSMIVEAEYDDIWERMGKEPEIAPTEEVNVLDMLADMGLS
jgi:hypothetical protein